MTNSESLLIFILMQALEELHELACSGRGLVMRCMLLIIDHVRLYILILQVKPNLPYYNYNYYCNEPM